MNDYNFKAFDKVLVRNENDHEWTCDIYSNYEDEYGGFYICTARNRWKQCVPYEGNEALLGTTDSPKPKRWRAGCGDIYNCINIFCKVVECVETNHPHDDELYSIGNYFRTSEEAQAVADRFKAMLKQQ